IAARSWWVKRRVIRIIRGRPSAAAVSKSAGRLPAIRRAAPGAAILGSCAPLRRPGRRRPHGTGGFAWPAYGRVLRVSCRLQGSPEMILGAPIGTYLFVRKGDRVRGRVRL